MDFNGSYDRFPHSTDVRLILEVREGVFDLSTIGRESVTLRKPAQLQPGEGLVVMWVDETRREWPVKLPWGAVPFDTDVRIVDAKPAA